MMTLRQIRYFVTVAEAGSVSAAGGAIGISQSAITEAIKTLEDETGATLFERHAKGVLLTYPLSSSRGAASSPAAAIRRTPRARRA